MPSLLKAIPRSVRCRCAATLPRFALLFLPLLLASCLKEQEDIFPDSASARMQGTMDAVKDLLRSADYGWELDYYPHKDRAYGGVVYLVKFDDLTVTATCSLIPDHSETSYYRLSNDNGPVLVFDTFNSLLHYFATPSSGEYEAKGGEFELVIQDYTTDLITLYGKKTHNTMYLRRLPSAPDDYATRTVANYDNFVSTFSGIISGSFDLTSKTMNIVTGTTDDGIPITQGVSFTFTNQGIRLYQPITINGTTVSGFAFDPEENTLTALTTDDDTTLATANSTTPAIVLTGEPFPATIMHFSQWANKYVLRYADNASVVDVELVPNRLEGTYRMAGLSPMYEIVLTYDYATGDLTLAPQQLGDINGNPVYLATYNGSSLWIGEQCSMNIAWNKNRFYPRYSFTPTNAERYDPNSIVLIVLSETEEGYTADIVDDSEWTTNGLSYLLNLNSLTVRR